MGQEVKNPLRAQSKYGLMGSSAKTGKFFFLRVTGALFGKKRKFGIGHPPPSHQLKCTCVGEGSRVPNLQTEFNYLDSFKSYGIFSDFVVPVVPTLFPSSPHHPVSSPSSPHHSHSPQKVPMWSPWLWSPWSPPLSPWSPPHVVPVVPMSSPSSPHRPHVIPIAPRRSPCGPHDLWSPLSPPHVVPMVPVVPTSSPSSPHRPHHLHIM